MMTETQLRAEVYNALSTVTNTYWLSKPIKSDSPFIIYQILDSISEYSFGVSRSAEERTVQVDLYVDPESIVDGDNKLDAIKTAMESIDYRQVGSGAEFLETSINKIIKVTRWERYNV